MPTHRLTMAIAAVGMLVSAAMAVWNADPIDEPLLAVVALLMLAAVIAPFAWALLIAWRNQGARWTHAVLLLAVVFAAGLSIYVNYEFANAVGKAKDPLMLAGALIYQFVAIGGAAFLNRNF